MPRLGTKRIIGTKRTQVTFPAAGSMPVDAIAPLKKYPPVAPAFAANFILAPLLTRF